jgi:hypothetical protein
VSVRVLGPTGRQICYAGLDAPTVTLVNCKWNTRRFDPGPYTLEATSYDVWGNRSATSISVTLKKYRGGSSKN